MRTPEIYYSVLASLLLLAGCSSTQLREQMQEKKVWLASEWMASNVKMPAMPPPQIRLGPLNGATANKGWSSTQSEPALAPIEHDRPVAPAMDNIAGSLGQAGEVSISSEQTGIVVTPNQCWAQAVIPPRRGVAQKVVTLRDEAVLHKVTPPVVQQILQEVVTKEGAVTFNVTTPRFRAEEVQVLVSEPVRKLVVDPAVYETRHEEVEVESSRIVMRNCRSPGQSVGEPGSRGGTVKCATELPARFQTITKQVLVKPEKIREEITPAVYKTVTRMVLDQPAQVTEVPLPESRTQLPLHTVQRAGLSQTYNVPAQTKSIEVVQHEGSPVLTWRRALCENDLSHDLIVKLQEALVQTGLEIGKIDGKLGKRTWAALQTYQHKEGLASGYLTYETLERLKLQGP